MIVTENDMEGQNCDLVIKPTRDRHKPRKSLSRGICNLQWVGIELMGVATHYELKGSEILSRWGEIVLSWIRIA